jgi:protein-disulfide isomerase
MKQQPAQKGDPIMRHNLTFLPILAALLFTPLGHVYAQDNEFATKARAWLLANPEVLIEAMEVLQTRQAALETASDAQNITANSAALFANPDDGFVGTGEVIAVEFFDYQCGYCKRQLEAVKGFNEAHPNHKIVLKELPILGPISEAAARAALAAKMVAGNDTYLAVHNGFLQHKGRLNDAIIDQILIDAGLRAMKIRAVMVDDAITRQIEANRALAARLGVNGTPGWVFKDEIARGLIDQNALSLKLEE